MSKELQSMEKGVTPKQKLYGLSIQIDSLTFDGRTLSNEKAKSISLKLKEIAGQIK